ncbi:MAG: hypothetical protein KDD29_07890 [Flavobacteriales bacterium]|nr:hypothetical protein [Flavobacteriales bacterium]
MCSINKISFKIIAPFFMAAFFLFACSKGNEPVPMSSVDADQNVSARIINSSSTANQNAKMSGVVGGDDHEDDDDNNRNNSPRKVN